MSACRLQVSINLSNIPSTDGIPAACLDSIMNYLLLGLAFQIDQFYSCGQAKASNLISQQCNRLEPVSNEGVDGGDFDG